MVTTVITPSEKERKREWREGGVVEMESEKKHEKQKQNCVFYCCYSQHIDSMKSNNTYQLKPLKPLKLWKKIFFARMEAMKWHSSFYTLASSSRECIFFPSSSLNVTNNVCVCLCAFMFMFINISFVFFPDRIVATTDFVVYSLMGCESQR